MPATDRLVLALRSEALVLPDAGKIAVLRATLSEFVVSMDPERIVCEQGFRPVHDDLAARGVPVSSHVEGPAAAVVVNLTRARAENLGNVGRGLAMLEPGGILVVDGAKTEGVDSLARQVGKAIPLDGQFPKAHGRSFWLTRPEILPPEIAEWAAGGETAKNAAGFVTGPGMFSPEHPDPGSVRLGEALGGHLKGRVADLGAGWGWLAQEALQRCPAITAIDLYELEASALDAARINVVDSRASFHWADVTRLGRESGPYDAVISNPPFHQGRAAEPELGVAFIAAAARILKPGGRLLMVANRQLPYEAALTARFRQWERLHEDGFYKVVMAQGPKRDGASR